jgi:predicted ribosome quality control (RQC) complex YloA/Tae2 family protein
MAWLAGAVVQKIERAAPECVVLTARSPDRSVHIALIFGPHGAIGALDARPKPHGPADSEVMLYRKVLEGARVLGVLASGAIDCIRGGEVHRLSVAQKLVPLPEAPVADYAETPISANDAFAAHLAQLNERARAGLLRDIERAHNKVHRRLAAVEGDLAKMAQADSLTLQGSLVLTYQAQIPRGAKQADVFDFEGNPVVIALDPAKSAKDNAEALFGKAKRLKRGRAIVQVRLDATRALLDSLRALRDAVKEAPSDAPLDRFAQSAGQLGVAREAVTRADKKEQQEHRVYRQFASGDHQILVGKSSADNDTLTTKIARPQDVWLHVRGSPGSHVVVRLDKNEACPASVLLDAAHLAIHFSSLASAASAEVQYTEKRYVRKPRGAAPGVVHVERETVKFIDVDAQRLERLLKP